MLALVLSAALLSTPQVVPAPPPIVVHPVLQSAPIPAPHPPAPAQSSPIEVVTPTGTLRGTWLQPTQGTSAAAVILPGSGPTDRDGNSAPLGIQASTYRLLAEALAQDGIATARIDKRGLGGSAAAGPSEPDLRFDAYVNDAVAWAIRAAQETGQPCAWLIGHSEGALVALAAANQEPRRVCGLVLLSGAGRPAGDVLREQLASLPEPLKTEAYDTLAELEAGRTVANPPAALTSLLRPSVQPYLISWLALDPAELIWRWQGRVLVAQGLTDLQTTEMDAHRMAQAQPDASLVLWPGVNHMLKTAPAERQANIATYMDPSLPLADGVASTVSNFLLDRMP